MVKVSSLHLTRTPSYDPSKLEYWMCVEDPFRKSACMVTFKELSLH